MPCEFNRRRTSMATKGDTAGTLYSVAPFSGGDKSRGSGDSVVKSLKVLRSDDSVA